MSIHSKNASIRIGRRNLVDTNKCRLFLSPLSRYSRTHKAPQLCGGPLKGIRGRS